MLDKEEQKRYSRQIILPEIGLSGQEKLKQAKVLMVGAGGLGCPVLQYLTAAGVGEIGIIDDDVIDTSNLHRQILYGAADIGKPKAVVAKEKLETMNPHVNIITYVERFTTENAARICADYDLVIDGSDNFGTRYLVNDTCVELGKTLVFGSIFKFEGHVSVFNHLGGPDYRDIFPEPPAGDEVPNCAEIGVLGVLPGIVGMYMANEAIKLICGIGETLSGKLMTLNALNNTTSYFKVAKRERSAASVSSEKTDDTQGEEVAPGISQRAAMDSLDPMDEVNPDSLKGVSPDTIEEVSMETLNTWLKEAAGEVMLIDVRETYEYEEDNIGGTNIPLYELMERIDTLPDDKKLVFCCQTGQRSKMAIQLVKPHFKGLMYSLKNGIS